MDAFKLTLVRHGETLENKLKIIQGHKDTILSEKGIRQAQFLAQRLENEAFSHVYSSDLRRAHQTCQIIMDQNKKSKVLIKTDVRLRERKLGSLEGQPLSSCRELCKGSSKQGIFGMESKQQLRQHAKSFFKDLCAIMDKHRQFISEQKHPHSKGGASSEESQDPLPTSVTVVKDSCSPDAETKLFEAPSNRTDAVSETKVTEKTSDLPGSTADIDGNGFSTSDSVGNLLADQTSGSRFAEHSKTTSKTIESAAGHEAKCRGASAKDVASTSNLPGSRSTGESEPECPLQRADLIAGCAATDPQTFEFFASALIVSHGGLLMELLAYFVKELKCVLLDSQKVVHCVIPNAGISRFVVHLGQGGKILPKVVCLSLFETDHLISNGEDLSPLSSSLVDLV